MSGTWYDSAIDTFAIGLSSIGGPSDPALYDTFSPRLAPAPQGTSTTSTPRLVTNAYGGYKQDQQNGLFGAEQAITLSWNPLPKADADSICRFLDDHVRLPFFYVLPRESTPRIWTWTTRQRSYPGPIYDVLTVSVEERFIP